VEAVTALAALHAVWWADERLAPLGEIAVRRRWETEAARAIGRATPMESVVPAFVEFLADRLTSEQQSVYRQLVSRERRLEAREAERPQTLMHGDAHWWNFLYPKDSTVDVTRLLDWGTWRVGGATNDLAYMLALHTYRPWRRHHGEGLLRAYHGALVTAGVRGYGWHECWEDYRWSVLRALFVAPHFWSMGVPAFIWWPKVECGLAAFEDVDGKELLAAL
jgi:aminoglycoside phosphotransferase (APT) family kinase protein